jgi:hypothetical protein
LTVPPAAELRSGATYFFTVSGATPPARANARCGVGWKFRLGMPLE